MYVLIGGDIRPNVIDALQNLVGKIKNEMVQEIESRSGGLLSFNLASVYVALRRLEERGCVSSRTEMTDAARARMRVYYHLEPAAEAYLTEQKEEYRRTAVGVQNVLKSCEVQHEKEA